MPCLFSDAVIGSYEDALNNTTNSEKSHPTPKKRLERTLSLELTKSVDTGDKSAEKRRLSFSSPKVIEAKDGKPRLSHKTTSPGMIGQRGNPVCRSYIYLFIQYESLQIQAAYYSVYNLLDYTTWMIPWGTRCHDNSVPINMNNTYQAIDFVVGKRSLMMKFSTRIATRRYQAYLKTQLPIIHLNTYK